MTPAPDPRMLASVHEAGHVVTALEFGYEVGDVWITARGGGHADIVVPSRGAAACELYLAGLAAEAVLLHLDDLDFGEVAARYVGDDGDLGRARAAVGIPLDAASMAGMLALPWRRAATRVKGRWADVERLAAALRCEGRLDGVRAAAVATRGWP